MRLVYALALISSVSMAKGNQDPRVQLFNDQLALIRKAVRMDACVPDAKALATVMTAGKPGDAETTALQGCLEHVKADERAAKAEARRQERIKKALQASKN